MCAAVALVLALGCGIPAQELGGIPEVWPGEYVQLVYRLIHDPPPGFELRYELTFSVELAIRPDGTYWARSELEGAFAETPAIMHLAGVPFHMLHSPGMALQVSYLEMLEPPFVPGQTYELRPRPMPPEMAFPMARGWLDITEEELEVAGVTAVEATLTTILDFNGSKTKTEIWLALPRDPVLPYPVWVRPPDDPAAAWMSEIKLVSFRLAPEGGDQEQR